MPPLQNQHIESNEANQFSHEEPVNYGSSTNNNSSNHINLETSLPRFSFDVLKIATNYFSEQNKLGAGSFGDVYKGSHLQTLIAVKRLKLKESQTTQFQAELVSLSRFRHPNIISILGYSDDGVEKCLVYEFAPNGSLRDRLDRKDNSPILIWSQRESIAMGIAIGMNYLQNADPHSPFFHLDLKSANILLDSQLVPKIADFGLAKPVIIKDSSKDSNVFTEATPVGDRDYICPEYWCQNKVSRKTDVYSYGCILYELLTGLKVSPDSIAFARSESIKKGNLRSKLDKTLCLTDGELATADIISQVYAQCTQASRLDRPSFPKVINALLNQLVLDAAEAEEKECTICSGAPISSVFKPCNHAVMCQNCAERWIAENKSCSVCHLAINSFKLGEATSFSEGYTQYKIM